MDRAVVAVIDANVLYRAPLRDLIIRLAQAGLIRAQWTDAIHDEWIRNLLANQPHLDAVRLARTRELMNEAVRDCLVSDYQDLIDTLTLPDPQDRHVLAAALRVGAEVIVTYNLKDFPANVLVEFDMLAQHPDDFLKSIFDIAPRRFCEAVKRQRESLRYPPKTALELLATLESHELTQLSACLRPYTDLL